MTAENKLIKICLLESTFEKSFNICMIDDCSIVKHVNLHYEVEKRVVL